MRQTVIPVLLVLIAFVTVAGPAAAQVVTGPPEDHFKVYRSDPPITFSSPMRFLDQFGSFDVDVMVLDKFATPAIKNNEPAFDLERHQTWWHVDVPQPSWRVHIENQFGGQDWQLGNVQYVVLPAYKNDPTAVVPPVANHYACYEALDGPLLNIPVVVEDQFDTVTTLVGEPVVFCNPAEKFNLENGLSYPIIDDTAHLACYRIDPKQYDLAVFALDQFGQWQFVIINQEWLCVPSFKTDATPTEKDTWGGIKTRYE